MGLLSGALSYRRYKVIGEVPEHFRQLYTDAIARFILLENDRARTKEDNVGWVNITDPGDTALDLNKFLFTQVLVLSMRVDRKRVPARYLKIVADRKIKETMTQLGLERLSASRRKEIKETIEEELLGRALPAVGTFDAVWDLQQGEVWFFSTADLVHDLFRGLFRDTFGLELSRVRLSDWLAASHPPETLAEKVENLVPEQSWQLGGERR